MYVMWTGTDMEGARPDTQLLFPRWRLQKMQKQDLLAVSIGGVHGWINIRFGIYDIYTIRCYECRDYWHIPDHHLSVGSHLCI